MAAKPKNALKWLGRKTLIMHNVRSSREKNWMQKNVVFFNKHKIIDNLKHGFVIFLLKINSFNILCIQNRCNLNFLNFSWQVKITFFKIWNTPKTQTIYPDPCHTVEVCWRESVSLSIFSLFLFSYVGGGLKKMDFLC